MRYKFKQEFSIGDEYGNNDKRLEVQVYITEDNISKSRITDMVYQVSLGFSELLVEEETNIEKGRNAQIDWNEVVAENKKQTWFKWFQRKNGRGLL